jgi:hypothetical protein
LRLLEAGPPARSDSPPEEVGPPSLRAFATTRGGREKRRGPAVVRVFHPGLAPLRRPESGGITTWMPRPTTFSICCLCQ